jgi:hypothetical protein
MNKIESIWYFMMQEIPTLYIKIIDRNNIEEEVRSSYLPNKHGWVARSGSKPYPNLKSRPDGFMPWHATKPLDKYLDTEQQLLELLSAVQDIYHTLNHEQVVFIHQQRHFEKSGVLRVDDRQAIVEAVAGWPEALSHGKINPLARYLFELPTMFLNPVSVEGDEQFLTPQELYWIGSKIERRLDYKLLLENMSEPVAVEFSFGPYRWGYDISAHDIMAGKAEKFQAWFDIARSVSERIKEQRMPHDELASMVEESFEKIVGLLEKAPYDPVRDTDMLSTKYNLSAYRGPPQTSMGSYMLEYATELLLRESIIDGKITLVNFSKIKKIWENKQVHEEDPPFLGTPLNTEKYLLESGYVNIVTLPEGEYVVPTEALLINQEIPLKY